MTPSSRLARYVTPHLTEERVTTQWVGSLAVARQRGRERQARVVFALGALCLVAGLVVFSVRSGPQAQGIAGTLLESGASELQRVTLPDGTRIELAAGTQVTLAELGQRHVRLRLERGGVTLDVAPRPERELVVEAARSEVIVVGTRFRVVAGTAPGEPRVTVTVERGAVRVRSLDDGGETRLVAGQSWVDPVALLGAARAASAAPRAPAASAVAPPAPSAAPSAERAAPTNEEVAPDRPAGSAAPFAALGPDDFTHAVSSSGPGRLFELYEQAQLAGRPAEAATALDQLRRRYPGDGRAGLAAFELGRLRQDQLGDPAGAVPALEDALRRGGTFGEDASARLVRAYQALGNQAACERARRDYLAKFSGGSHAEAVRRQCRR